MTTTADATKPVLLLILRNYRPNSRHVFLISRPRFFLPLVVADAVVGQDHLPVFLPHVHRMSHRELTLQRFHQLFLEGYVLALLDVNVGVLIMYVAICWIYCLGRAYE